MDRDQLKATVPGDNEYDMWAAETSKIPVEYPDTT